MEELLKERRSDLEKAKSESGEAALKLKELSIKNEGFEIQERFALQIKNQSFRIWKEFPWRKRSDKGMSRIFCAVTFYVSLTSFITVMFRSN